MIHAPNVMAPAATRPADRARPATERGAKPMDDAQLAEIAAHAIDLADERAAGAARYIPAPIAVAVTVAVEDP